MIINIAWILILNCDLGAWEHHYKEKAKPLSHKDDQAIKEGNKH